MADEAQDASQRVAVVSPDGTRGTVMPEDLPAVLGSGGKVVPAQQLAEEAAQKAYDALPTTRKASGYLSVAEAALTNNPTVLSPDAPPTLAALGQGARHGLTAGLSDVGEHALASAVGGEAKAAELTRQRDLTKEASPTAYGAGQAYGFTAGAVASGGAGAARAVPQAGISALGGGLEATVAKALGGLATKGALGRAATTAASMGVRGAFEGASLGAIDAASDSYVHDTPVFGEKLYAAMGHGALAGGLLGGGLGGAGSLAASGARSIIAGTLKGAGGALSLPGRAASGAEEAIMGAARSVDEAASGVATKASLAADEAKAALEGAVAKGAAKAEELASKARTAASEAETLAAKGTKAALGDVMANPEAAASKLAGDQAFRAVGGGFGLQSTRYAAQAAKYFEGGTAEVGQIGLKYGLIDMGEKGASPLHAAFAAAKSGTPDAIAARATTALDAVGAKIGAITETSGATVSGAALNSAFEKAAGDMGKSAFHVSEMKSLYGMAESLADKLGMAVRNERGEFLGFAEDGAARVQDVLAQRKFLDQAIYQGKKVDAEGLLQLKRDFRTQLEGAITDALDASSGKLPGELRAEYKALKKDYQGLSIIQDAAEDSAVRASKAATFGFAEKFGIMSALASGNILAAPVLGLGGKILKERGNAAAAAFLTRATETGQLAAAVRRFDEKVTAAASGVLREAPPAPASAPARKSSSSTSGKVEIQATQEQAKRVVEWVGQMKANPAKLTASLEEAAEVVRRSAGPKAADAYTQSTIRALSFIAAHIPARDRRDPLDPRSVPPLTREEAATLNRATRYALKPESIFDDFQKGVVTPEGLRAAKTFAPEAFADFQAQLQNQVTEQLMRSNRLNQAQRLRVDRLLGYPAGADLRPETIARLQANLVTLSPDQVAEKTTGNQPVNLKTQQSGFDSVEARKSQ